MILSTSKLVVINQVDHEPFIKISNIRNPFFSEPKLGLTDTLKISSNIEWDILTDRANLF